MLKKTTAVLSAVVVATALTNQKAYAWKSPTHEYIALKAIELLKIDGYIDAYELYSKYEDTIASHTQKPDYKGDFDKGKGWHYYCVTDVHGNVQKASQSGYRMSGKNLLSPSRYCRTARTIFEDNYQSALTFYKAGDIEKAMQFVARCVHMIADIGCTPHTTNLTLTSVMNSKHKRYEYHTSSVFTRFEAKHGDADVYDMFMKDNLFGDCLNTLSDISANSYDTVVKAPEESLLDETIENAVCLAQQYVAGFLVRFYTDAINGKVNLLDGGRYYIRNVQTGKYLSVLMTRSGKAYNCHLANAKRVTQSLENCSAFICSINDDGSYIFTAENNRILSAKPYTVSEQKKLSFGFKAGETPNGFRLSDKLSSYNAVLCVEEDKLALKAYNPDELSHHWVFEKA